MKKILFYFPLAFILGLMLFSCSSTGFMKRKYMPGHFFNSPNADYSSKNQSHIIESKTEASTGNSGVVPDHHIENDAEIKEIVSAPGEKNIIPLTGTKNKAVINENHVPEKTAGVDKKTTAKNKFLLRKSPEGKGTAWLSFLCGLLAFYPLILSSIVFALLAVIFGLISIIKRRGLLLAFFGILLGIIGVLLVLLGLLALSF